MKTFLTQNLQVMILQCLESARPLGAPESLLLRCIGETRLTSLELRAQLLKLNSHGLVELSEQSALNWRAKLSTRALTSIGAAKHPHLH